MKYICLFCPTNSKHPAPPKILILEWYKTERELEVLILEKLESAN